MFYYFYLFAQTNLGRSFQRHSRNSKSIFANKSLILIVLGIGAVWAGLYYWDKWRKKNVAAKSSTDELFDELCQAHQLVKAERLLLSKVSEDRKLDDPALLFVNPELFSNSVRFSVSDEKRLESLAKKLFGKHWEQPQTL